MRKLSYYLVNAVTAYRVLAAPFLLLLLLTGRVELFRWLLLVSFLTDAVDGFLARRFNVVSPGGFVRDSFGDDLTVGVALTGLAVLHPVL